MALFLVVLAWLDGGDAAPAPLVDLDGPLTADLRRHTRPVHDRIEALPYAIALRDGNLPLLSYLHQLRALAVIHGALEQHLPAVAEPRLQGIWRPELRRLPALLQDLDFFARQPVGEEAAEEQDSLAVDAAAQALADAIIRTATEQPIGLLGYLYVLEGSRLGARVLTVWAQRCFGLAAGQGLAYLGQGRDTERSEIQALMAQLDALSLTDAERDKILAAAERCFVGIEAIMAALYSFSA